MGGLVRAEWLRLRKRRALQAIVLAVPLLVAFFYFAGFASIPSVAPFDEAALRAQLIADGYGVGLPPDEAEQLIAEVIESERVNHQLQLDQVSFMRERFAFPQSIVMTLGSGTIMIFALLLLTATTVGDEFGWGTVRSSLLANSERRRFLAVRFGALVLAAAGILAAFVLLGVALPPILALTGASLPVRVPVDAAGVAMLLGGNLVVTTAAVAFAMLATLLARSGSLTLVAVLVYLAIEAAILTLLSRFEPFQFEGDLAWLLDLFPIHGMTTLINTATAAASGLGNGPAEPINRALDAAWLPLVALLVWAGAFAALSFRRFSRMDIVE